MRADAALARRIESDEAQAIAESALAYAREVPDAGVATLAVAGGWAAFAGVGSFLTQAKGLGLNGPVESADFDRLEEFYKSRGAPAQVEVCPHADPSLLEIFHRGYRVLEFENALVAEPSRITAPPADSPGVKARRIESQEIDLWTETCARGFFPDADAMAKALPAFRGMVKLPDVEAFLATVDGSVAGAGAVGFRDGLAGFFATSVLPAFRGRGAHRELIRIRVEAAREAGCDLFRVGALPGSGSQRNFERWGFHPAYTKTILIREW